MYAPYRSVAIWSLAIALRSSLLCAADRLVIGVLASLPNIDPVGVELAVVLPFAACLAAFSWRRFCFDAETFGAIFGLVISNV